MKRDTFPVFNMPSVFQKITAFYRPKQVAPIDTRYAQDVVNDPQFGFYDPATLTFPNKMNPVVPGNANVTLGLGMVPYDNQPTFDRGDTCLTGPVRLFFREVLYDNRVKHVG